MSELSFEYAKALFFMAKSEEEKKTFHEDLKETEKIMTGDIYRFFTHPEININDKKALIEKDFPLGTYRNFLLVLTDNNRLDQLSDIEKDYENILLSENETIKGIVYSSKVLSKEYIKELEKRLFEKTARTVLLTNEIDSSIIGGIKIVFDSKIIDLTLNTKMEGLIRQLKE